MNPRWAWRFSVVTHPLFLNYLGFLLLFWCIPALRIMYTSTGLSYILGLYFLNVVVLPLILLSMMKHKGVIDSYDLPDKQQRKLPLILISLLYIMSYYLFQKLDVHRVLLSYLLSAATILIFTSLLNNFYKISLHAVGAGALLGLICSLQFFTSTDLRPLVILALLLCGFILTARNIAGNHTRAEYLTGLAVGFGPMWWMM